MDRMQKNSNRVWFYSSHYSPGCEIYETHSYSHLFSAKFHLAMTDSRVAVIKAALLSYFSTN